MQQRFEDVKETPTFFQEEVLGLLSETYPMLVFGYIGGLMALTFFALHTGLHISNFWMYMPMLPWIAAAICVLATVTFFDWFDDANANHGRFSLAIILLLAWPMLAWSSADASSWLMKTRFVPLLFTAACLGIQIIWQVVAQIRRRSKFRVAS
jgi:hypothetical protein